MRVRGGHVVKGDEDEEEGGEWSYSIILYKGFEE
jgi:hypothetical protein